MPSNIVDIFLYLDSIVVADTGTELDLVLLISARSAFAVLSKM